MDSINHRLILLRLIVLMDASEGCAVYRLKADEETLTAGFGHLVEQVGIIKKLRGDSSAPDKVHAAQLGQKRAGVVGHANEIIINKKDVPCAQRFNISQNIGDGALYVYAVFAAVVAKTAAIGAAPAGSYHIGVEILAFFKMAI